MVFLKVVLVGLASPRGLTVQCFPQKYFSPTPPFHFSGARGSRRAAVGQPCGACAPPRLLDRRLALWRRGRRYSNFALPIKSARPLLFSRRNLAGCFFFIGVCNFQAAYSCIIVE